MRSPVLRAVPVVLLLVFASCQVAQVPEEPSRPDRVVVGYYTSWTKAEFDHTRIEYEYLTHIAHAFAWPDSSGNLVVPADLLYPALNAAAHDAGVKMILSLGGWGNCAGFPGMTATAANRYPVHRPARRLLPGPRLRRRRHRLGVRLERHGEGELQPVHRGPRGRFPGPDAGPPRDHGRALEQLLRALDRLRAPGRRFRPRRLHDLRLSWIVVRPRRPQLAPFRIRGRHLRLGRRDVPLRPQPPGAFGQAAHRRAVLRPVLRLRRPGPAVHDERGLVLQGRHGLVLGRLAPDLGHRGPGALPAPDRRDHDHLFRRHELGRAEVPIRQGQRLRGRHHLGARRGRRSGHSELLEVIGRSFGVD